MYNQALLDKIENLNLQNTNADIRVLTQRWKQPGDVASFKSLVSTGSTTTNSTSRFVQNNNYLNANSVTVGYTIFSRGLIFLDAINKEVIHSSS